MEYCTDQIEPAPYQDEADLMKTFSAAVENFLSELPVWQRPFLGSYREVIWGQSEQLCSMLTYSAGADRKAV